MTLLENINSDCLEEYGLEKEGCSVNMDGAPSPRIVIDLDEYDLPSDEPRCDYLLISEGKSMYGWISVFEFKRGGLKASKVVRQLQAGACTAERLVPHNQSKQFQFRPVAVFGNSHKHQRDKLMKGSCKNTTVPDQMCLKVLSERYFSVIQEFCKRLDEKENQFPWPQGEY